ncbi:hypothetical protein ONZ45_g7003 [Pleurotus djamor]|nr:hypothetical protein ONZ45_g7003 [Pleurotus djamor]
MSEFDERLPTPEELSLEYVPQVVAFMMSCIVYGLYVPMFSCSLHALHDTPNQRVLFVASILLYVMLTASFILGIFTSYTNLGLSSRPPSMDYLGARLAQSFLFVGAVVTADGVFTYRLFHVWGRKWWPIILPVVLILAIPAAIFQLSVDTESMAQMYFYDSAPFISLVTNLYITGKLS